MLAGRNISVKEKGPAHTPGELPAHVADVGELYFRIKRSRKYAPRSGGVGDRYTAALARCIVVRSSPTINAGFTVHMV